MRFARLQGELSLRLFLTHPEMHGKSKVRPSSRKVKASPDAWEKARCTPVQERSKLHSKYYLLMGEVQPQAPLICLGEVGVYLPMSQSARWELLGREKQGRERGVQSARGEAGETQQRAGLTRRVCECVCARLRWGGWGIN